MQNRRLVVVAIFAMFVASIGAIHHPRMLVKDPTQGKWNVTVTPDDDARSAGEKEFKDTLTFKGSTFSSQALQKHGFDAGPYDEDARQGGIAGFDAMQVSKTEGKAKWSGFITVDQIEGELTWTKSDGTSVKFAFKGEKQ